jgi:hypothetical protein
MKGVTVEENMKTEGTGKRKHENRRNFEMLEIDLWKAVRDMVLNLN